MGRQKQRVRTLDDGVIESVLPDNSGDAYRVKKKRDNISDKANTQLKAMRIDVALGGKLEEESIKTEFASIEDDLLSEIEDDSSDFKDDESDEEVKSETGMSVVDKNKLKAYSRAKIAGDSAVLNGLKLTQLQRKFIINFCNPDKETYNNKFEAFIEAGYNADNRKVLIANVSKLLGNQKIKDGIDRYRRDMINSKKFEISTENIDMLRKRANYSISTFYKENGDIIPYSEIPPEWICCIDDIVKDLKGSAAKAETVKYKLCDRQKSMDTLNKLLDVQQAISGISGGRKDMSITAALDAGADKNGDPGPRVGVTFKISTYED